MPLGGAWGTTPLTSTRFALKEIIQRAGQTDSLKLCFDAADAESFTSGQSWLDRSGNGYDFFLGTTSGADATDPTFNGTAGGRSSSEYFTTGGNDFFRYDTTNEAWMQTLHKDNAVFSSIAWLYAVDTVGAWGIWGTRGASGTGTGATLVSNGAGGGLLMSVKNAGADGLTFESATAKITAATWSMAAVSVDEAAGIGLMRLNQLTDTFTSTYTTPAAGDASFTMEILASGNAVNTGVASGNRIASIAIWQGRALSAYELSVLFEMSRLRFGV